MAATKVICKTDGSIRIEGDFTLGDKEGNLFDLQGRNSVSLCRCGASQNKPFCDGAHRAVGFRSEIKARPIDSPSGDQKPTSGG